MDLLNEVQRPQMRVIKLNEFGLFAVASGLTNSFDDLVQDLQIVFPGSPGSLLGSTLASIIGVPLLSFYLTRKV